MAEREICIEENAPYVGELIFRDGGVIPCAPGEITLLVGPNNAGKTYLLKTIRALLYGKSPDRNDYSDSVLEGLSVEWLFTGARGEAMLFDQIEKYRGGDSFYDLPRKASSVTSNFIPEGSVYDALKPGAPLGGLAELFVTFDDVRDRLDETTPQRQVAPTDRQSLVQQAWDRPGVSADFAERFLRVFGEKTSYYNPGWGEIGLLLAPALDSASTLSEPISHLTKQHMEESPKLWEQGYGMRSVAGLLLRICAGESSIVLIDEPEAFLHPPQASALGSVLADLAALKNKQIFVATHDRNFIASLIRSSKTPLQIVRLSRQDNLPKAELLNSESIRSAQRASEIRFTPFLDSLFADFTILVENERDAVFYDEALRSFVEESPDLGIRSLPDRVLFLSGGGFPGLPKLARALREMGLKVRAIADFDVLFNDNLPHLVRALAEETDVKVVIDLMDNLKRADKKLADLTGQETAGNKPASKKIGIYSEDIEFNELAKRALDRLDEIGIHLVDVGELEDLFTPTSLSKKGGYRLVQALTDEMYANEATQRLIHRVIANAPDTASRTS